MPETSGTVRPVSNALTARWYWRALRRPTRGLPKVAWSPLQTLGLGPPVPPVPPGAGPGPLPPAAPGSSSSGGMVTPSPPISPEQAPRRLAKLRLAAHRRKIDLLWGYLNFTVVLSPWEEESPDLQSGVWAHGATLKSFRVRRQTPAKTSFLTLPSADVRQTPRDDYVIIGF